MEPSIANYENTLRILGNLVHVVSKNVSFYDIEDAAKSVEAYAFLQNQVKELTSLIATKKGTP